MDVRQTLELIARHFNVDGFGEGREGLKQLVFDDDLVVLFNDRARRDGIWMEMEIGLLPEEEKEEVLRSLLKRNVFAAHKDYPWCVLREDQIILQEFLNCEILSPYQVGEKVEAFINHGESWRKFLSKKMLRSYETGFSQKSIFNGMIKP
ncbi:MAG: CesT family type III secretion system chaperone [Thermodesulforhabdaceae bacterium]